ncbi:hypothetical protein GCM10028773_59760 [Spirosoma koreense]
MQFSLKACTGRQLTIQTNVSTLGQYDTYVINWGDGSIPVEMNRAQMEANPQHIYPANSSNTPTVTVEGVYGSLTTPICRSPNQQTVALASDVTQPVIQALKTVDAGTITIQYQVGAVSPVQVYQRVNGTYTAINQTATGPGTFTVKTDAKQVQCFKVTSQDVCGSASLESDEVCSLVLDAKADNKKNNLTWQSYAGKVSSTSRFRYYRILRNNAPLAATITNQNTSTFTDDNAIECGTQYCYSLVATIDGTAQTEVTSAPVCVTGVSGTVLDSLGTVVVSVENNRPTLVTHLTTGAPTSYTLQISRAEGASGTFSPLTTLVDKDTFVDDNANAATGSYCYQVSYQGGCGIGLPPSKPVCTVFLNSSTKTSIDWTGQSPFVPGSVSNYAVELIDSSRTGIPTKSVGTTTHYDRDLSEVVYTYRIVATSGGNTSYSNYYTFAREDRFTIPDAFTPNGDHVNDSFLPKGLFADHFIMNIYSRWGEVVFSTTDKTTGWDGMVNGLPANQGQYMYRVEVEDIAGQKTVRTGTLLLLR